jgi:hypothetical protein
VSGSGNVEIVTAVFFILPGAFLLCPGHCYIARGVCIVYGLFVITWLKISQRTAI